MGHFCIASFPNSFGGVRTAKWNTHIYTTTIVYPNHHFWYPFIKFSEGCTIFAAGSTKLWSWRSWSSISDDILLGRPIGPKVVLFGNKWHSLGGKDYPSPHNHGSEKWGPSNRSFLSCGVVFHFHDCGRRVKMEFLITKIQHQHHHIRQCTFKLSFLTKKKTYITGPQFLLKELRSLQKLPDALRNSSIFVQKNGCQCRCFSNESNS